MMRPRFRRKGREKSDHRWRSPGSVDPGEYTVILERTRAFREYLVYLSWTWLRRDAVLEGASFMTGQESATASSSSNVTIADRSLSGGCRHAVRFRGRAAPAGTADRPRDRARRGLRFVLRGEDEADANTGHALPAPNTVGPLPLNIVVKPGAKSADELVRETNAQIGVLVCRTWYAFDGSSTSCRRSSRA